MTEVQEEYTKCHFSLGFWGEKSGFSNRFSLGGSHFSKCLVKSFDKVFEFSDFLREF